MSVHTSMPAHKLISIPSIWILCHNAIPFGTVPSLCQWSMVGAGEENTCIKQMVTFRRMIWSPEVYDFFTSGSFVVLD